METLYIGEQLMPGRIGHFLAVFSFVATLFSILSYWKAVPAAGSPEGDSRIWRRMGRAGFLLHSVSVLGLFVALYYIITHHLFEYSYAWEHASRALPLKYLLSCFWEGQEGSFMLWSFWHCILGIVVMTTSGKMESRVMVVIGVIELALATMLLGFYFSPEIKIGSSPFMLLRDKMQDVPVFARADYLSLITDGNGLNPLLQNYWMTIHPPVLFLGFASTLIPFAYSIAALWQGDYKSWVKPARTWSLFAGGALGLGIMMGGAWAYESLTFGGYWAWDPVENASLVPWLTLVAGLHTLIVFSATGRSLGITFILLCLSYLFVWYSTFLTRTGVLGDTSVHSFTGEGSSLYWHLLGILLVLLAASAAMIAFRWKSLPRVRQEEKTSSREFWMFIGSFVLLLSAVQISISTSIPVWAPLAKWITGKDIAPPVDPIAHYNNIQVWVAVIIALLTATILFLRFRKTDMVTARKRLLMTALVAAVATVVIAFTQAITGVQYILLLFSAVYTIIATLYYAFAVQKQLKKAGAAITHLGFGLMLLGVLLSSYNKEVISINTLGISMDFGKENPQENIRESMENTILFLNTPVAMADYLVTYKGDSSSTEDPRTFYRVHYQRRDSVTGKVLESFMLYPNAFVNPKGQERGLIANPDAKHYFHKDIFTYVTKALDPEHKTDTSGYTKYTVKKGDSIFLSSAFILFRDFEDAVLPEASGKGDISVRAKLEWQDMKGNREVLTPAYIIRENRYEGYEEDTLQERGLYVRFVKIHPETGSIELMIRENNPENDYIVMKALVFPFINVLWLGIVVMTLGFFLSTWNRATKKEKKITAPPAT